GEVLVAGGLIDLALAAPFGIQRLHRHAIRLYAAIAASLADELVDDDALVGIGKLAAFPPAALLGRASLVVDQDGDARRRRELPLHFIQIVAVMDFQARGPMDGLRIFLRLVGHELDAL